MVKYVSIKPDEFYSIYRSVSLYFKGRYDIEKYGFRSKKFLTEYHTDPLRHIYEIYSKSVASNQEAIFLIIANIITNSNTFITNFSLDLCYNKQMKRYHANKINILLDFEEYLKTHDIHNKIETGALANDVTIKKDNIILFSYINKIVPIVDIARKNNEEHVPDTILELFYGSTSKAKKETKSNSLFDKLSFFVELSENEKNALRPRIEKLLEIN